MLQRKESKKTKYDFYSLKKGGGGEESFRMDILLRINDHLELR